MSEGNASSHETGIIDETYDKIHAFGIKHLGKHPNCIYLSREHLLEFRNLKDYRLFAEPNQAGGTLETIMGMQIQIHHIDEISVQ